MIWPYKGKIPIAANRKGDTIKRVIAAVTTAPPLPPPPPWRRSGSLSFRGDFRLFSYLRLSRYPLRAAFPEALCYRRVRPFSPISFFSVSITQATSHNGLYAMRKVAGRRKPTYPVITSGNWPLLIIAKFYYGRKKCSFNKPSSSPTLTPLPSHPSQSLFLGRI